MASVYDPNKSELSRELEELRESANRLNALSGDINHVIAAAEKDIVATNAGFEYWLDNAPLYESDPICFLDDREAEVKSWTSVELGFAKFDEGWKLAIREVECSTKGGESDLYNYNPGVKTPLLSATRNMRISAIQVLPRLVRALVSKTQETVAAIEAGNRKK